MLHRIVACEPLCKSLRQDKGVFQAAGLSKHYKPCGWPFEYRIQEVKIKVTRYKWCPFFKDHVTFEALKSAPDKYMAFLSSPDKARAMLAVDQKLLRQKQSSSYVHHHHSPRQQQQQLQLQVTNIYLSSHKLRLLTAKTVKWTVIFVEPAIRACLTKSPQLQTNIALSTLYCRQLLPDISG